MLRTSMNRFVALAAVAILETQARANQLCQQASTAVMTTNFNAQVVVPKFDSGLGILDSITIALSGHIEGFAKVENFGGATAVTTNFSAQVILDHPNGINALVDSPTVTFQDFLSSFDGVLDFRGTSGVSHTGISFDTMPPVSTTTSDPNVLALYAGPSGNPGTVMLPVSGLGQSSSAGAGNLITQFQQSGSGAVTVCYNYTPRFSSYCSGDGSGVGCPCGNTSPAGQGCLNSFGFGSTIQGSGSALVSADTVVLTATMGASAPNTFFQGTAKSNNGLGSVFGDGLRCASGTTIRLGSAPAVMGIATYPHSGDAPVSVRGQVPPGSTRYYQAWYRQAAAFCTPATFNLSQGLQVVWGP